MFFLRRENGRLFYTNLSGTSYSSRGQGVGLLRVGLHGIFCYLGKKTCLSVQVVHPFGDSLKWNHRYAYFRCLQSGAIDVRALSCCQCGGASFFRLATIHYSHDRFLLGFFLQTIMGAVTSFYSVFRYGVFRRWGPFFYRGLLLSAKKIAIECFVYYVSWGGYKSILRENPSDRFPKPLLPRKSS